MSIFLTNTLTHKKEEFKPIKKGEVGIYSCGPTVYWNQHIGNMYAFMQWDLLVRTLKFLGYKTKWVMNITDVGHMTSDEDTGDDKMEKGAKRENLTVWQIADKYIAQYKDSIDKLNIHPDILCRATENISEQIALIKKIEKNGFTYQTKLGLVFDTSKFADYVKFAGLKLDKQQSRADLVDDPEKKSSSDFFLWVTGKNQVMQWDSPWGKGYPGWHIECTAMSTKYLGNKFDIHTGGIEHINVHHTNEIAQGYGAFGEITANYWLHNAWLLGKKGEKISKSLGNVVTVQELEDKKYDPLTLRYLFLTSHYRKGINFSLEALDGAASALKNLRSLVNNLKSGDRTTLSPEKLAEVDEYREKFVKALSDDLNVPQALAILWEMLKSNIPSEDKYDLAMSFDEVLGLELNKSTPLRPFDSAQGFEGQEFKALITKREELRKQGKYEEADKIREEIEKLGHKVSDNIGGTVIE